MQAQSEKFNKQKIENNLLKRKKTYIYVFFNTSSRRIYLWWSLNFGGHIWGEEGSESGVLTNVQVSCKMVMNGFAMDGAMPSTKLLKPFSCLFWSYILNDLIYIYIERERDLFCLIYVYVYIYRERESERYICLLLLYFSYISLTSIPLRGAIYIYIYTHHMCHIPRSRLGLLQGHLGKCL